MHCAYCLLVKSHNLEQSSCFRRDGCLRCRKEVALGSYEQSDIVSFFGKRQALCNQKLLTACGTRGWESLLQAHNDDDKVYNGEVRKADALARIG